MSSEPPPARELWSALDRARLTYWERPAAALEVAVRCQEQARLLGDEVLRSRALILQGAVSLHRGDLRGCLSLATRAERPAGADLWARAELAALNAHLHFFSGAYARSLSSAKEAVELADRTGDRGLRLHARRMGCLAFGNVGVDDLPDRFAEVLALARELESPWEQGVAHNDLAQLMISTGDHAGAAEHLEEGLQLARRAAPAEFLFGVLHATRSELRLAAGRPIDALADACRAVDFVLAAERDANPYLLGMAVLTEVHALLALGEVGTARDAGERAIERLDGRVPQAAGMILSAVAGALREAGRAEQAYDALARGAELERAALRELSELQVGMERARLEALASRREADALGAKNRELESLLAELAVAHTELEQRAAQLEDLQEQLRDQADRDWLTGVRNRRFLARTGESGVHGPVSLAVVDLDHFKSINDRFGHQVGDRVLVRVARLLEEHVRSQDVVVRIGGEEFAILMPESTDAEAAACCERLCALIASEPWHSVAPDLRVTASIGVVSAPGCHDLRDLERVADERLYAAKRGGRDRVVHGLAA